MADPTPADRSHSQPEPPASGPARDRPGASLPAPLTSFVGREREVAAVRDLVGRDGVRLVTLTGPGGVGKTRLALEAARRLADGFDGGACFVALAAITDPGLVGPAFARALGVRHGGTRPLAVQLGAVVGARRRLVLLDNLEQVLDAAPLLAEVLAACPGLTILATSREPLRLSGEHEYPVPPLGLPEADGDADVDALRRVEAVALFEQRARAARPDFALGAEDAPAVAALCRQLDGLPLAIELAAARAKVFSPRALLARLDQRLGLLTGGPSDAPARLRTMRDAIGWSHDLLTEEERVLFRRLAVFAGGFTLEAADAVVGEREDDGNDLGFSPPHPPMSPALLDGVVSLLDKSLLRREALADVEPRFGMLETIRAYALERLAASGEEAPVRDRHAAWCLDLADQFRAGLGDPAEAPGWLRRMEAEHDNMRAALAWLEHGGHGERMLRLAAALNPLWGVRGYRTEAIAWLERALALGPGAPPTLRVPVLRELADHLGWQGHYGQARALLEEALALARQLADPAEAAHALRQLGVVALNEGSYDRATTLLDEAQDASGPYGRVGIESARHWTCYLRGVVAYGRGAVPEAVELVEEALAGHRAYGDFFGAAIALDALALLRCEGGDGAGAAPLLAEALPLWQQAGNREGLAEWLAAVARLAACRDRLATAARLYGAAEAATDAAGVPLVVPPPNQYRRHIDEVRLALGPDVFAAAWAEGRALPLAQATTEALAATQVSPVGPDTPASSPALTRREREVLRLIAEGRTDREVASALFIGERTVEWHLANTFTKLGVGTRAAAAAVALRRGLI